MKIQTHIQPRRDGSVIVRNAAGKAFTFTADASGALVCDIDDPALAATLLCRADDFEPADPADFEVAESMVADLIGADGDEEEAEAEDDGAEIVNGGLPVEANTPPRATARPRKAR